MDTLRIEQFQDLVQTRERNAITADWLLERGFKAQPANTWHGNGCDWQPAYPRTHQVDYVYFLSPEGKKGAVILYRFTAWTYLKDNIPTTEHSTGIYFPMSYYPKVAEENLPYESSVDDTLLFPLIVFLLTGVTLQP